jgi:hypothetical protein
VARTRLYWRLNEICARRETRSTPAGCPENS